MYTFKNIDKAISNFFGMHGINAKVLYLGKEEFKKVTEVGEIDIRKPQSLSIITKTSSWYYRGLKIIPVGYERYISAGVVSEVRGR